MIACMGGWCNKREQCPHYVEAARVNPVERLCVRGRDGVRLIHATPTKVIAIEVMSGDEVRGVV